MCKQGKVNPVYSTNNSSDFILFQEALLVNFTDNKCWARIKLSTPQDVSQDFVMFVVCLLQVKETKQHLKCYIKQIQGFYFYFSQSFS